MAILICGSIQAVDCSAYALLLIQRHTTKNEIKDYVAFRAGAMGAMIELQPDRGLVRLGSFRMINKEPTREACQSLPVCSVGDCLLSDWI